MPDTRYRIPDMRCEMWDKRSETGGRRLETESLNLKLVVWRDLRVPREWDGPIVAPDAESRTGGTTESGVEGAT
jgi:hypothetical protein